MPSTVGSSCRCPASSPVSIASSPTAGEHASCRCPTRTRGRCRSRRARAGRGRRASRCRARASRATSATVNELSLSGRFKPQPADVDRRASNSSVSYVEVTSANGIAGRRRAQPQPSGRPRPGSCSPATVIIPAGSTGVPSGTYVGEVGRREHLVRTGRRPRAGPRGSRTGRCSRHPRAGSPRRRPCPRAAASGSSSSCVSFSSLHTAATSWSRIDRDEHATVAEPLRDAHAEVGRDLAHRGCGTREHAHRFVVAELVTERREAREVDEREPSLDSHGRSLSRPWTDEQEDRNATSRFSGRN